MRFFDINHYRGSKKGDEFVSFGLRVRRGESLRGELLPTGSWTSRERQKAKAIAQVILDGEVALIHEIKEGRGTGLRKAMIFTRLESELLGESPRRESGTRQPDWQVGKRNPLPAKEPPKGWMERAEELCGPRSEADHGWNRRTRATALADHMAMFLGYSSRADGLADLNEIRGYYPEWTDEDHGALIAYCARQRRMGHEVFKHVWGLSGKPHSGSVLSARHPGRPSPAAQERANRLARQYQAWHEGRRNPLPVLRAAVTAATILLPLAQKAGANWLRRYKAAPVDEKVKMLSTASWVAGPTGPLGWKFLGKKMRRDIAIELDAQLKDPEVMEAAGDAMRTTAIAVATRGRARNNPGPAADYLDILAHLRALQWLYTSAHWNSRGPNSYGDHLLYQRLYEGLGESIDQLGERYVAYYGPFDPVGVSNRASGLVADFRRAVEQMAVPVSHLLLLLEQQTQKMIRVAWKANQESSDMSLGLDDYLMALANNRDEAVYLLKQRSM